MRNRQWIIWQIKANLHLATRDRFHEYYPEVFR